MLNNGMFYERSITNCDVPPHLVNLETRLQIMSIIKTGTLLKMKPCLMLTGTLILWIVVLRHFEKFQGMVTSIDTSSLLSLDQNCLYGEEDYWIDSIILVVASISGRFSELFFLCLILLRSKSSKYDKVIETIILRTKNVEM